MFSTSTQHMKNIYKTWNNTSSTRKYNQKDTSYPWITSRRNQPIQILKIQ